MFLWILNNFRIKIVLLSVVLWSGLFGQIKAQTEIQLDRSDSKNRQTSHVSLYDTGNGNFLLELPLTFHITKNNILFMFIGDEDINANHAIWIFDKYMGLDEITKKNKNLEIDRGFRKNHTGVEPFFEKADNVELLAGFQNNYEYVQSMPQPVFFKIKNIESPLELRLRFYVSSASGKDRYTQMLTAESGTVKIRVKILN